MHRPSSQCLLYQETSGGGAWVLIEDGVVHDLLPLHVAKQHIHMLASVGASILGGFDWKNRPQIMVMIPKPALLGACVVLLL